MAARVFIDTSRRYRREREVSPNGDEVTTRLRQPPFGNAKEETIDIYEVDHTSKRFTMAKGSFANWQDENRDSDNITQPVPLCQCNRVCVLHTRSGCPQFSLQDTPQRVDVLRLHLDPEPVSLADGSNDSNVCKQRLLAKQLRPQPTSQTMKRRQGRTVDDSQVVI